LKLAPSGCGAVVVGSATLDGRNTVEIADPGHWSYYVDATTYQPVELDLTGAGGASLSLHFETYEQLPAQANEDLLSLTAQHPTAAIDNGANDYTAAQARLFPSAVVSSARRGDRGRSEHRPGH
jgi:hypothetical protein